MSEENQMSQWTQATVESNNRRQRAANRKADDVAAPAGSKEQALWDTYHAIEGSAWDRYNVSEGSAWQAYREGMQALWGEAQAKLRRQACGEGQHAIRGPQGF